MNHDLLTTGRGNAQENFPDTSIVLETEMGNATHQKTDVFRRQMWYSMQTDKGQRISCLTVNQVLEIIGLNKNGKKPEKLLGIEEAGMASMIAYQNSAGLESLTRFEDTPTQDKDHRSNRKKKRYRPYKNRRN